MDIQDIQPSDVLLFSGLQDDWLSRAIMLLTGSPVSHAALGYRDSARIIEEVGAEGTDPGGVEINDAATRFAGRTITVRRVKDPQPSMLPVLDAADAYFAKGEPFGMANLVIVGLLLIYRKLPHSMPAVLQAIVMRLLERLAKRLMEAIDQREHPGKQPMFCSQFAFQCYQDAGPAYQLRIVHGLLIGGPGEGTPAPSLVDHALAQPLETLLTAGTDTTEEVALEDLLRQLVMLLEQGALDAGSPEVALEPRLLKAVRAFAKAIHATYGAGLHTDDAAVSLAFAKEQEACFVTPADLYANCPDLATVGTIP